MPDFQRTAPFSSYHAFHDPFTAATITGNLDAFWTPLVDAHQVPCVKVYSVALLCHGAAGAVSVACDFNGRSPAANACVGTWGTWIFETTLPTNAPTDYKLFLDGNDRTLDSVNTRCASIRGSGPPGCISID